MRSLTLRTVFLLLSAVITLNACGGGNASSLPSTPALAFPAASLPPTASLLLPPTGSIYLGGFINPNQTKPPSTADIAAFETQIGRTLAITPHYYGFYDSFPGPYEQDDLAHGRISVESWDCQPPNAGIASGTQDDAIRKRADALKAFGHPIFLRYMWEMNLPSNAFFRNVCYDPATDLSNGRFSPDEYIAAWKRIRQIFAQEGVTNVIWLWNVSGSLDSLAYYPGGSEVDWAGFDKYDDANLPFQTTYQQAYAFIASLGKPIMVGETGAAASIQPQFFAAAASALRSQYPLIKAYVYFDSAGFVNNWDISGSGLSAFATMAADPYFSAMASTL